MIQLPTKLNYLQFNDRISRELEKQNLRPKNVNEFRWYPNLSVGLSELFPGTASFLSHKKKILIVEGASWVSRSCQAELLRNGKQVITLSFVQANDSSYFESLTDLDVSMVLLPCTNPLTGEIFQFKVAEEICLKKRIFHLNVYHSLSILNSNLSLNNYQSLLVESHSGGQALGLLGPRLKTPLFNDNPIVSPTARELESDFFSKHTAVGDRSTILKFESELQKGWQPLVLPNCERDFQFSLIGHPEQSGELILQRIRSLNPKSQATTYQLSHQKWLTKDLDWWHQRPSWDLLRGSLVIPACEINHELIQCLYAN